MKRLLAILLALSMTVNLAPLSAIAASDNSSAQTITVNSQPDEDLAQAIASDPFLTQANSAPQEQNATVDTSNMSMEATNSFGKLLLNGMDEENGSDFSSENAITGITMNGSTAVVSYRAAEAADLVVGIYADDAEEEMIANGTVSVQKTTDTTAKVSISGKLPEYYVIKGYLFDKTEHAPLCEAFRDVSQTKDMVDLGSATVDSFDADRVINLDDDKTTNFAVVKQDVTLLTPEDAAAGKNTITQQDDDGLNYTISNASEEIKNLQAGDILTYEYEPGAMLIVKVANIQTSGDTVTIHGDDSLEITDVFEAVKIEQHVGSSELVYDGTGADDIVTYLGTSDSAEENSAFSDMFDEAVSDNGHADFSVKNFSLTGKASEKDSLSTAEVKGTADLNLGADYTYYLFKNQFYAAALVNASISGKITVTGKLSVKLSFGMMHTTKEMEKAGVVAYFNPRIVLEFGGSFCTKYSYQQLFGISYETGVGFTNLGKPGTGEIVPLTDLDVNYKYTGPEFKVFIGIEIGPEFQALAGNLQFKFTFKGGYEAVLKKSSQSDTDEIKHECEICFSIENRLLGELTIAVLIFKHNPVQTTGEKKFKKDLDLLSTYWSVSKGEYGVGTCPHQKYRMTVTVDDDDVKSEDLKNVDIVLASTGEKVGTFGGYSSGYVYLPSGEYQLKAVIKNIVYTSAKFTVSKAGFEIWLGMDVDWILENGVLTIYNDNAMGNAVSISQMPWYSKRKEIREVIVKSGVTRINSGAFNGCENLEKVKSAETITSIGDYAFNDCKKLTDIVIPKNVTEIGYQAFGYCTSLKAVEIPSGVSKITSWAFTKCSALTTVKICEGVTTIGFRVFDDCENLTSVEIPSTVTKIEDMAFKGCKSLVDMEIPSSVTSIGSNAFEGCSSLKNAKIPNGIEEIKNGVFSGCTSLESVEIPESVKVIGISAFRNCGALKSVHIPSNVTYIGDNAFMQCGTLTNVEIPEGEKMIRQMTFLGCGNLKSISLPASVQKILQDAFKYCRSLKDITYAGTKAQWSAVGIYGLLYDGNKVLKDATIHCTDGDMKWVGEEWVDADAENSITTGKTTEANAKPHAVFNGLTAGEEYTVIVSKSATNPFDTNNLIYVNQKTAGANGVLDVPFISGESGTAAYVVACRKGGSSSTGGNTSKDDTTKPSDSKKDDGSGAIVAVVLIGGAAIAAVTAGVILMMPVEVSGVAQLNDGAVLANATVQLMKDGQQVAQTTTDESGRFALEVKRGEYTLNVITTNPETGEQIVHTTSVKAPAKNTNFVF